MKAGDEIIHVIKGELNMGRMKELWAEQQEQQLSDYCGWQDDGYYQYLDEEMKKMKANEAQLSLLLDILDKEKNPYVAFDKIAAAIDQVRTKLYEATRIDDKSERDKQLDYQRFMLRHLATAVQEHGLVASIGWDANVVLRGKEPELS